MPGLSSFATHAFGPRLAQELIKNSRDSEQGVGKRLQMAFLNLAEKQLLDAEMATQKKEMVDLKGLLDKKSESGPSGEDAA